VNKWLYVSDLLALAMKNMRTIGDNPAQTHLVCLVTEKGGNWGKGKKHGQWKNIFKTLPDF